MQRSLGLLVLVGWLVGCASPCEQFFAGEWAVDVGHPQIEQTRLALKLSEPQQLRKWEVGPLAQFAPPQQPLAIQERECRQVHDRWLLRLQAATDGELLLQQTGPDTADLSYRSGELKRLTRVRAAR